jgi:DDE family transposase/transposase-like protein DUF772
MTLGRSPKHEDLYRSTRELCESRLPERSIFRLLAAKAHELFPDEAFADLYAGTGRRSVAPRIIAVTMVLQRYSGMSDREAVDAFTFDARWKYAAGALDFDHPGFVHTVLVEMRERLRRSDRPNRIFEAVVEAARDAGLIGRKRVLDSTALYDAVATQDTVTLVRSALVGLLEVVGDELAVEMRSGFEREDDYRKPGKPVCDWDDDKAREALVDALALDASAALAVLHGRPLEARVRQAAELLATVLGQDLEQRDDGLFFIAHRVAEGRIISTVDPEARHGHKTAARGFDGYKGHVSVDPDSEIVVATEVTPGNVGDAVPAAALLEEVLETAKSAPADAPVEIYGDSSYGTAALVEHIEAAGAEANVKVQPPTAAKGHFAQDTFTVDTDASTVTCPNGVLVQLRLAKDGSGVAEFAAHCGSCPLRSQCTDAASGRTIRIHPKFATLTRGRVRQRDPEWKRRYRAIRPKVERKIGHLMRRKHGGRRARVRGCVRVGQDFALLAASVNLARLAVLGLHLGAGS